MQRIKRFNVNRINSAYSKASYLNEGILSEDDKIHLDALWAAKEAGEGVTDVHIHFDGDLGDVKDQLQRQETSIDEIYDLINALDVSSSCNCKDVFATLVDKDYLEKTLEEYAKESEINDKLNVNLIAPPPIGLEHRDLYWNNR